jgi:hypothetical protein
VYWREAAPCSGGELAHLYDVDLVTHEREVIVVLHFHAVRLELFRVAQERPAATALELLHGPLTTVVSGAVSNQSGERTCEAFSRAI